MLVNYFAHALYRRSVFNRPDMSISEGKTLDTFSWAYQASDSSLRWEEEVCWRQWMTPDSSTKKIISTLNGTTSPFEIGVKEGEHSPPLAQRKGTNMRDCAQALHIFVPRESNPPVIPYLANWLPTCSNFIQN